MSTNKKKTGALTKQPATEAAGPATRPIIFLEFGAAHHNVASPTTANSSSKETASARRHRADSRATTTETQSRRPSSLSKDGAASNDTGIAAAEGAADATGPVFRLEFELAADLLPRTVENFKQFVCGTATVGDKKNLRVVGYKGTRVLRCTPWFMQCGDVLHREDGKGQESIYGPVFDDEHLGLVPHGFGVLTMVNSGPNTNGSQFAIIVSNERDACAYLDQRYQAFGTLVSGEEQASQLRDLHSLVLAAGVGSESSESFAILNCGVVDRSV